MNYVLQGTGIELTKYRGQANTYDRDNDVAILKGEIKIMWLNSIM
jgi:hypothetical protein